MNTKEIGDYVDNQRSQSLLKDYSKSQTSILYNPYEKPADLKMAQNHGKAKKIYKARPESEEAEYIETCPCCGLPVHGERIPLNDNLKSIYHLGSGYALYFRMVKYSISLLVIFFGLGIFNIITNAISHDCGPASDDPQATLYCIEDYISIFSVANKRNNEYALQVSLVLSFVTVVMIILFFHYIRYQIRKTKVEADDRTISPSDYTLKLIGVSSDISNQDIKEWIESFATSDQPIKVEKVIRSYDIYDLIKLMKNREELIHEKEAAGADSASSFDSKIEDLTQQINKYKDQKIKDAQTPVAFVILDTAHQTDFILKTANKSITKEQVKYFAKLVARNQTKLGNRRIKIRRASEPSDVLWENLGVSRKERLKRKAFTTFCAILLILVSFALVITLSWAQEKFIKENGQASAVVKTFSIVSSILVMVINYLMGLAIRALAEHEKHGTYTSYFNGMATKLNAAQFVNAAFTTLVAKIIVTTNFNDHKSEILQRANFYSAGGLMEGMFFVFITGALSTPISTFLDPWYYLKIFQRYRASKTTKDLNQKQAHEIFEDPSVDMSYKYSLVVKSVLLASFYAPSLPIILVFAIFGLTFIYWVDKYIFLRRSALPFSLGSELAESMIEHLEWSTFIYSLGNLLVVYSLDDQTGELAYETVPKIWAWLAIIVSLVHIFLPMAAINESLFDVIDEVTENIPYSKARSKFFTDYDVANPISHEKAIASSRKERREVEVDKRGTRPLDIPTLDTGRVTEEELKIDLETSNQDLAESTFEDHFGALRRFAQEVQVKPMKAKLKNPNPKLVRKNQLLKVLSP